MPVFIFFLSASSRKLSGSPRKLSANPRKVSANARKLSGSPRKLSASSRKLSASSRKLSASPRKLSGSPRKLSANARKLSGSPRKVSGSPRKLSASPRELSGSAREVAHPIRERNNPGFRDEVKAALPEWFDRFFGGCLPLVSGILFLSRRKKRMQKRVEPPVSGLPAACPRAKRKNPPGSNGFRFHRWELLMAFIFFPNKMFIVITENKTIGTM